MEPQGAPHQNLVKKTTSRILAAVVGIVLVLVLGVSGILYVHNMPAPAPAPLAPPEVEAGPAIVNGIDQQSGLIAQGEYLLVKQNCLSCHSGKLITQNRMSREGWLSTIRWMQETQNLAPLGDNEAAILDYLGKYYAPNKKGRRANLTNIEWYDLEE